MGGNRLKLETNQREEKVFGREVRCRSSEHFGCTEMRFLQEIQLLAILLVSQGNENGPKIDVKPKISY